MITDEQKLFLLQKGVNNAETFDEARDYAEFIIGNNYQSNKPSIPDPSKMLKYTEEETEGRTERKLEEIYFLLCRPLRRLAVNPAPLTPVK